MSGSGLLLLRLITLCLSVCLLLTVVRGAAVGPDDVQVRPQGPVVGSSEQKGPAEAAGKAEAVPLEGAVVGKAPVGGDAAVGLKHVAEVGVDKVDEPIQEKAGMSTVITSPKQVHGDPGFPHAFVASFSMITVSEIGDKTFFISAIMAMRHSRLLVFSGAIAALALMHTMSALFGLAAMIIPQMYTYYASSALFAIFGVRMLREGWYMSPDEGQEEFEETQAELKKYDEGDSMMIQDPETGVIRTPATSFRLLRPFCSAVFLKAATLNFLAEWGDRSQITAIILATREDVAGVIVGGVLGHALCTGMAVICGRFISQRISVRTVTLAGGVTFLIFALSAFVVHPS